MPAAIFLFVVFVVPLGSLLLRSVTDPQLGLGNYVQLLGDITYRRVLTNTFTVAAVVTLVTLLLGYPVAWLLVILPSRVARCFFAIILLSMWTNLIARTYAWMVLLQKKGVINSALIDLGLIDKPLSWLLFSEPAVHFGLLGPFLPNMVWPIFLSLVLIDDELLEASKDIGASPWQTLRHVILPLAMPGILAGIIFSFVPMLGDDVVAKVLGGQQVLMLGGAMLDLITALNYSVAAAMSALILGIIALLQLAVVVILRRIGRGASLVEGLRK